MSNTVTREVRKSPDGNGRIFVYKAQDGEIWINNYDKAWTYKAGEGLVVGNKSYGKLFCNNGGYYSSEADSLFYDPKVVQAANAVTAAFTEANQGIWPLLVGLVDDYEFKSPDPIRAACASKSAPSPDAPTTIATKQTAQR